MLEMSLRILKQLQPEGVIATLEVDVSMVEGTLEGLQVALLENCPCLRSRKGSA